MFAQAVCMGRKKQPKDAAAVKLGATIREARELEKRSQEFVAKHFGLTRQAVGAWESGESMPNGMQLRELAVLLNNARIVGVNEDHGTYLAGSSLELRVVHSVPLKRQITPVNGGFWMDNENDSGVVRGRVHYFAAAPHMYAYQVFGDEVLVKLTDGRSAILQFIGKKHGMVMFQRISIDQRPVSLAEAVVESMHFLRNIAKPDDFISDDAVS